ncbi:hypothetical protein [Rhizobium sp. CSW-27]|nr:hypothetical protein [Rhizobium sp. CSW-27]MBT9368466.1 hypothetical protein [Rhizobium sp. CSW-27]
MAAFPSIGTGYAFGFEGDEIPGWAKVHGLWLEEGARRKMNRHQAV